jgi:glutamine synthetase
LGRGQSNLRHPRHPGLPGRPASGVPHRDAYSGKFPRALQLPATLSDAAGRLRKSTAARDIFGESFVDHYAYTREWEDAEQRKAVTDWQLQRYFEII